MEYFLNEIQSGKSMCSTYTLRVILNETGMLDPEICTQTPSRPPQIFHLKSRPQKLGCSLPVPLHQSTGCTEGGTSGLIPVWILFPGHLCSPTNSDLRSPYLSGLFPIFMQIRQLLRILSLCLQLPTVHDAQKCSFHTAQIFTAVLSMAASSCS